VGDVFNDLSTPYHLTTMEFAQLVKANLADGGIYMINIIDDFQKEIHAVIYLHLATGFQTGGFIQLFK